MNSQHPHAHSYESLPSVRINFLPTVARAQPAALALDWPQLALVAQSVKLPLRLWVWLFTLSLVYQRFGPRILLLSGFAV